MVRTRKIVEDCVMAKHHELESEEGLSMHSDHADLPVAGLIDFLRDRDPVIRWHAATVLAGMGEDAEPVVPTLIELLESSNVHDRRLATLTLGEIGPIAGQAIPALVAAVHDADEGVADMASWALEQIDPTSTGTEAA